MAARVQLTSAWQQISFAASIIPCKVIDGPVQYADSAEAPVDATAAIALTEVDSLLEVAIACWMRCPVPGLTAVVEFEIASFPGASAVIDVAANIGSVNTVAGQIDKVSDVAAAIDDITRLYPYADSIVTVSGSISSVDTVAAHIASVVAVAGISPYVDELRAISSNIDSVLAVDGLAAQVAIDAAQVAADQDTVQDDKVIATLASDTAVGAQTAAEAARDATLAAFDNFDDRYLGPKAADPIEDNDGDPLVAGQLYYNTVAGAMKVYTGAIWTAAYVAGDGVALLANNGLDYDAAVFRTNLDLYSTAQVNTLLGGKANAAHTHVAANISDFSTAADLRVSAAIGVSVQGYDAKTLKANANENLTAGYTATAADDGAKASGTYTPAPAGGNLKRIVNGGAFSLAAPSAAGDYTLVIQITNNATAGAITLTGFSKTTGDAFTTVNGDDFFVFIAKINGFTHAHVQGLQ